MLARTRRPATGVCVPWFLLARAFYLSSASLRSRADAPSPVLWCPPRSPSSPRTLEPAPAPAPARPTSTRTIVVDLSLHGPEDGVEFLRAREDGVELLRASSEAEELQKARCGVGARLHLLHRPVKHLPAPVLDVHAGVGEEELASATACSHSIALVPGKAGDRRGRDVGGYHAHSREGQPPPE
jgi:hypothetical protein